MKSLKAYALIFCLSGFVIHSASSQDESFLYGDVTTIDNRTYSGAIRWGKEEVYWTDLFNASKINNENLKYLSREEEEYLNSRDHDDWGNSWVNVAWSSWEYKNDHLHQFVTAFGNISSITPRSRDKVDVKLQNGEIILVDGDGYNDLGSDIKVYDDELGIIELDWSRIEKITFKPTPKKLENKFGEALFGKVICDQGIFTGYIQWDHDERVSSDKLDGDTDDGDVSIAFGKVKSIERIGYSQSEVVLKSGRALELRGSNDVNSENRGVIVTVEGLGRIDIPWKSFESVEFLPAPSSAVTYKSFERQAKLEATVTVTNGDVHTGELIYDLDESFSFEVLNGKDDDTEFEIEFDLIKQIKPKNYNYSLVELRNGDEFLLGDSQDVTDENDGLIVRKGNDTIYIPWEKVSLVEFK
ncbi:MAG: hypothetical protein ACI8QD_000682 [Cyclobacteriaceae bacterium]|jgi:hypothetical protein